MTRRWLLTLGTLLMLVPPASAWAAPRERTLANGLRVLVDADSLVTGVDVAVWYSTGLAEEPAGKTGITHLMERVMFMGSPRFAPGEYPRRLGEAGATFNTFLAPDFTAFYCTGPAQEIETLLALEADRMAGQRLAAPNVAAAARALGDEHRRLEDSPVTRVLQKLYATAFGTHPYANPIQGRAADLVRLTPAACAAYARGRYAPGNALVTVVGRFNPDSAEAMLARTFGVLPARAVLPSAQVAEPAAGERRGSVRSPVRMVLAGWRAPADSLCGAELALIAQVLGAGSSPRLATELVRNGKLAIVTSCVFDGRRRASFLYATAVPAPNSDSAKVESELVGQVERLAREPLTDTELTRARKALLLAARIDRQSVRGRAQALGAAMLTDGDWRAAESRLARIEKLTAQDVQEMAARVLTGERRTIVWTAPPIAPAPNRGARR